MAATPPEPLTLGEPPAAPPEATGCAPPGPETPPAPDDPDPARPPVPAALAAAVPPRPFAPAVPPVPVRTAGPPLPATPRDPLSPDGWPASGGVMICRLPKGRPLSSPHAVAMRAITTKRGRARKSCDPGGHEARCMSSRPSTLVPGTRGLTRFQKCRIAARLPGNGDRGCALGGRERFTAPRGHDRCYRSATT